VLFAGRNQAGKSRINNQNSQIRLQRRSCTFIRQLVLAKGVNLAQDGLAIEGETKEAKRRLSYENSFTFEAPL
jgi:hypothetical protein